MGRIEEGLETKGSEIYGFKREEKKKQMTEKQRKPDKKLNQ